MISRGVRRLDVGGKLLSKLLAKMVSFKQFKLDSYIQSVGKMKEEVCFIEDCCTEAFKRVQDSKIFYVLPDPDIGRPGYITKEKDETGVLQMLTLSKERFTVPETIFSPQM